MSNENDNTTVEATPIDRTDMIEVTIQPYGVELKAWEPATVEKFDSMAGRVGACLELGIKQEKFHGQYGDIRQDVTAQLIELGHERKVLSTKKVETKDEETGEVTSKEVPDKVETDAKFFNRICATLDAEEGTELGANRFKAELQLAADRNQLDPSRKERVAAEKKVGKAHLEAAQGIADNGAMDHVASRLSEILGTTVDVSMGGEDAVKNLAKAIGQKEAADKKAESLTDKYSNL